MDYGYIDARERILHTTIELILKHKDANKITIRQIANEANVNSALINYYFRSKENLLNQAVAVYMENMANEIFDSNSVDKDPVIKLRNMIKKISTFAFDYYYLSEIVVTSEVNHGSLNTNQMILPLLREIFEDKRTETELKLMALQLLAPLQVIFLNAKKYQSYLLEDIFHEETRNELIDKMIDIILKGGYK